jgi:hypothetical protein
MLVASRYVNVGSSSWLRSVFYVIDEVVWNLSEKLTRLVIVLNAVNRDFAFSFVW